MNKYNRISADKELCILAHGNIEKALNRTGEDREEEKWLVGESFRKGFLKELT